MWELVKRSLQRERTMAGAQLGRPRKASVQRMHNEIVEAFLKAGRQARRNNAGPFSSVDRVSAERRRGMRGGIWRAVSSLGFAIAMAIRLLNPYVLISAAFGQHRSLLAHLSARVDSMRAVLSPRTGRRRRLTAWIQDTLPQRYVPEAATAVWEDGSILCGIVETAVPGACPGYDTLSHPKTDRSATLWLGQKLAARYLGVPPVFNDEDLAKPFLTLSMERRLLRYLSAVRAAAARVEAERQKRLKAMGGVNSTFDEGLSSDCIVQSAIDPRESMLECVARGMGLILGVKGRRSTFYLYLNPNHPHRHVHRLMQSSGREQETPNMDDEAGAVLMQIRGPDGDFGASLISTAPGSSSASRGSSMAFLNEHWCGRIPIVYETTKECVKVSFVPQAVGTHELTLLLRGGSHVPGSPFSVSVEDSLDVPDDGGRITRFGIGRLEEWKASSYESGLNKVHCRSNSGDSDPGARGSEDRLMRQRRRVVSRVVDFVTEKMLLTEEGKLERLPRQSKHNLERARREGGATLARGENLTRSRKRYYTTLSPNRSRIRPSSREDDLQDMNQPHSIAGGLLCSLTESEPLRRPEPVVNTAEENTEEEITVGEYVRRKGSLERSICVSDAAEQTSSPDTSSVDFRDHCRRILWLCDILLKHRPRQESLEILNIAGNILDGKRVHPTIMEESEPEEVNASSTTALGNTAMIAQRLQRTSSDAGGLNEVSRWKESRRNLHSWARFDRGGSMVGGRLLHKGGSYRGIVVRDLNAEAITGAYAGGDDSKEESEDAEEEEEERMKEYLTEGRLVPRKPHFSIHKKRATSLGKLAENRGLSTEILEPIASSDAGKGIISGKGHNKSITTKSNVQINYRDKKKEPHEIEEASGDVSKRQTPVSGKTDGVQRLEEKIVASEREGEPVKKTSTWDCRSDVNVSGEKKTLEDKGPPVTSRKESPGSEARAATCEAESETKSLETKEERKQTAEDKVGSKADEGKVSGEEVAPKEKGEINGRPSRVAVLTPFARSSPRTQSPESPEGTECEGSSVVKVTISLESRYSSMSPKSVVEGGEEKNEEENKNQEKKEKEIEEDEEEVEKILEMEVEEVAEKKVEEEAEDEVEDKVEEEAEEEVDKNMEEKLEVKKKVEGVKKVEVEKKVEEEVKEEVEEEVVEEVEKNMNKEVEEVKKKVEEIEKMVEKMVEKVEKKEAEEEVEREKAQKRMRKENERDESRANVEHNLYEDEKDRGMEAEGARREKPVSSYIKMVGRLLCTDSFPQESLEWFEMGEKAEGEVEGAIERMKESEIAGDGAAGTEEAWGEIGNEHVFGLEEEEKEERSDRPDAVCNEDTSGRVTAVEGQDDLRPVSPIPQLVRREEEGGKGDLLSHKFTEVGKRVGVGVGVGVVVAGGIFSKDDNRSQSRRGEEDAVWWRRRDKSRVERMMELSRQDSAGRHWDEISTGIDAMEDGSISDVIEKVRGGRVGEEKGRKDNGRIEDERGREIAGGPVMGENARESIGKEEENDKIPSRDREERSVGHSITEIPEEVVEGGAAGGHPPSDRVSKEEASGAFERRGVAKSPEYGREGRAQVRRKRETGGGEKREEAEEEGVAAEEWWMSEMRGSGTRKIEEVGVAWEEMEAEVGILGRDIPEEGVEAKEEVEEEGKERRKEVFGGESAPFERPCHKGIERKDALPKVSGGRSDDLLRTEGTDGGARGEAPHGVGASLKHEEIERAEEADEVFSEAENTEEGEDSFSRAVKEDAEELAEEKGGISGEQGPEKGLKEAEKVAGVVPGTKSELGEGREGKEKDLEKTKRPLSTGTEVSSDSAESENKYSLAAIKESLRGGGESNERAEGSEGEGEEESGKGGELGRVVVKSTEGVLLGSVPEEKYETPFQGAVEMGVEKVNNLLERLMEIPKDDARTSEGSSPKRVGEGIYGVRIALEDWVKEEASAESDYLGPETEVIVGDFGAADEGSGRGESAWAGALEGAEGIPNAEKKREEGGREERILGITEEIERNAREDDLIVLGDTGEDLTNPSQDLNEIESGRNEDGESEDGGSMSGDESKEGEDPFLGEEIPSPGQSANAFPDLEDLIGSDFSFKTTTCRAQFNLWPSQEAFGDRRQTIDCIESLLSGKPPLGGAILGNMTTFSKTTVVMSTSPHLRSAFSGMERAGEEKKEDEEEIILVEQDFDDRSDELQVFAAPKECIHKEFDIHSHPRANSNDAFLIFETPGVTTFAPLETVVSEEDEEEGVEEFVPVREEEEGFDLGGEWEEAIIFLDDEDVAIDPDNSRIWEMIEKDNGGRTTDAAFAIVMEADSSTKQKTPVLPTGRWCPRLSMLSPSMSAISEEEAEEGVPQKEEECEEEEELDFGKAGRSQSAADGEEPNASQGRDASEKKSPPNEPPTLRIEVEDGFGETFSRRRSSTPSVVSDNGEVAADCGAAFVVTSELAVTLALGVAITQIIPPVIESPKSTPPMPQVEEAADAMTIGKRDSEESGERGGEIKVEEEGSVAEGVPRGRLFSAGKETETNSEKESSSRVWNREGKEKYAEKEEQEDEYSRAEKSGESKSLWERSEGELKLEKDWTGEKHMGGVGLAGGIEDSDEALIKATSSLEANEGEGNLVVTSKQGSRKEVEKNGEGKKTVDSREKEKMTGAAISAGGDGSVIGRRDDCEMIEKAFHRGKSGNRSENERTGESNLFGGVQTDSIRDDARESRKTGCHDGASFLGEKIPGAQRDENGAVKAKNLVVERKEEQEDAKEGMNIAAGDGGKGTHSDSNGKIEDVANNQDLNAFDKGQIENAERERSISDGGIRKESQKAEDEKTISEERGNNQYADGGLSSEKLATMMIGEDIKETKVKGEGKEGTRGWNSRKAEESGEGISKGNRGENNWEAGSLCKYPFAARSEGKTDSPKGKTKGSPTKSEEAGVDTILDVAREKEACVASKNGKEPELKDRRESIFEDYRFDWWESGFELRKEKKTVKKEDSTGLEYYLDVDQLLNVELGAMEAEVKYISAKEIMENFTKDVIESPERIPCRVTGGETNGSHARGAEAKSSEGSLVDIFGEKPEMKAKPFSKSSEELNLWGEDFCVNASKDRNVTSPSKAKKIEAIEDLLYGDDFFSPVVQSVTVEESDKRRERENDEAATEKATLTNLNGIESKQGKILDSKAKEKHVFRHNEPLEDLFGEKYNWEREHVDEEREKNLQIRSKTTVEQNATDSFGGKAYGHIDIFESFERSKEKEEVELGIKEESGGAGTSIGTLDDRSTNDLGANMSAESKVAPADGSMDIFQSLDRLTEKKEIVQGIKKEKDVAKMNSRTKVAPAYECSDIFKSFNRLTENEVVIEDVKKEARGVKTGAGAKAEQEKGRFDIFESFDKSKEMKECKHGLREEERENNTHITTPDDRPMSELEWKVSKETKAVPSYDRIDIFESFDRLNEGEGSEHVKEDGGGKETFIATLDGRSMNDPGAKMSAELKVAPSAGSTTTTSEGLLATEKKEGRGEQRSADPTLSTLFPSMNAVEISEKEMNEEGITPSKKENEAPKTEAEERITLEASPELPDGAESSSRVSADAKETKSAGSDQMERIKLLPSDAVVGWDAIRVASEVEGVGLNLIKRRESGSYGMEAPADEANASVTEKTAEKETREAEILGSVGEYKNRREFRRQGREGGRKEAGSEGKGDKGCASPEKKVLCQSSSLEEYRTVVSEAYAFLDLQDSQEGKIEEGDEGDALVEDLFGGEGVGRVGEPIGSKPARDAFEDRLEGKEVTGMLESSTSLSAVSSTHSLEIVKNQISSSPSSKAEGFSAKADKVPKLSHHSRDKDSCKELSNDDFVDEEDEEAFAAKMTVASRKEYWDRKLQKAKARSEEASACAPRRPSLKLSGIVQRGRKSFEKKRTEEDSATESSDGGKSSTDSPPPGKQRRGKQSPVSPSVGFINRSPLAPSIKEGEPSDKVTGKVRLKSSEREEKTPEEKQSEIKEEKRAKDAEDISQIPVLKRKELWDQKLQQREKESAPAEPGALKRAEKKRSNRVESTERMLFKSSSEAEEKVEKNIPSIRICGIVSRSKLELEKRSPSPPDNGKEGKQVKEARRSADISPVKQSTDSPPAAVEEETEDKAPPPPQKAPPKLSGSVSRLTKLFSPPASEPASPVSAIPRSGVTFSELKTTRFKSDKPEESELKKELALPADGGSNPNGLKRASCHGGGETCAGAQELIPNVPVRRKFSLSSAKKPSLQKTGKSGSLPADGKIEAREADKSFVARRTKYWDSVRQSTENENWEGPRRGSKEADKGSLAKSDVKQVRTMWERRASLGTIQLTEEMRRVAAEKRSPSEDTSRRGCMVPPVKEASVENLSTERNSPQENISVKVETPREKSPSEKSRTEEKFLAENIVTPETAPESSAEKSLPPTESSTPSEKKYLLEEAKIEKKETTECNISPEKGLLPDKKSSETRFSREKRTPFEKESVPDMTFSGKKTPVEGSLAEKKVLQEKKILPENKVALEEKVPMERTQQTERIYFEQSFTPENMTPIGKRSLPQRRSSAENKARPEKRAAVEKKRDSWEDERKEVWGEKRNSLEIIVTDHEDVCVMREITSVPRLSQKMETHEEEHSEEEVEKPRSRLRPPAAGERPATESSEGRREEETGASSRRRSLPPRTISVQVSGIVASGRRRFENVQTAVAEVTQTPSEEVVSKVPLARKRVAAEQRREPHPPVEERLAPKGKPATEGPQKGAKGERPLGGGTGSVYRAIPARVEGECQRAELGGEGPAEEIPATLARGEGGDDGRSAISRRAPKGTAPMQKKKPPPSAASSPDSESDAAEPPRSFLSTPAAAIRRHSDVTAIRSHSPLLLRRRGSGDLGSPRKTDESKKRFTRAKEFFETLGKGKDSPPSASQSGGEESGKQKACTKKKRKGRGTATDDETWRTSSKRSGTKNKSPLRIGGKTDSSESTPDSAFESEQPQQRRRSRRGSNDATHSAPGSDVDSPGGTPQRLPHRRKKASEFELRSRVFGGSERQQRVSERFNVMDLFRDVAGFGSGGGSDLSGRATPLGIPHQAAVLAALRSVEDVRCADATSPYDMYGPMEAANDCEPTAVATNDENANLEANEGEDGNVNFECPVTLLAKQEYQAEYPHLPMTSPRHSRHRSLHADLIPRNKLLQSASITTPKRSKAELF